ncbi:MAG TPA: beta galactosidase jelly roll domain-containing protein, partial [Bacteroidales bacterium]|nr:beta galactosidase jelly roll domain-containing protein [Bacteroidales bacterium]
MKRNVPFYMFLIVSIIFIAACSQGKFRAENRDRNFNEGWMFIRDSVPGNNPQDPAFDDSKWSLVDLPHDWSITPLPGEQGPDQIGPFSKKSPGATSTGYVMGGTAWYRKHFALDKKDEGKTVIIRFDGVYMESEVWVNGKQAGNHVYGYTPFYYDITNLLNDPGSDNVIAVKVNNTGRNTRWYSGSGIYRNVTLTVTEPVHVDVWGVQVITHDIDSNEGSATIKVKVRNNSQEVADAKITIEVFPPDATMEVASVESDLKVNAAEEALFEGNVVINNPVLWSPSAPKLYQAKVTIETNGKIADEYLQNFGMRTVEISAQNGLLLNGEPLELKGGCMHHDNGLLGSAAFERAEERRVQIMKDNGFNAIRTS